MDTSTTKCLPREHQLPWACLLAFMFLFSSTSHCLAAGGDPQRYSARGTITAIESKNSVVISGKGYLVDQAVLVENEIGRPIPLLKLIPPAQVEFEYCYMARAPKSMTPVIIYIKVTPKSAVHKKVSR